MNHQAKTALEWASHMVMHAMEGEIRYETVRGGAWGCMYGGAWGCMGMHGGAWMKGSLQEATRDHN